MTRRRAFPFRTAAYFNGSGRMLIQCQSCNTKYRLNLEQIPRRKTFVRCKSCGTPIYIDPTEPEEAYAGVIPPPESAEAPSRDAAEGSTGVVHPPEQAAPAPAEDHQSVVCPGCGARYRVAAASVQRPGVRLKCSQCGYLFDLSAAQPGPREAQPAASRVEAYEPIGPSSMEPTTAGAPGEMPLPDQAHMEQLFDDLRPETAQAVGTSPDFSRDPELGTLEGASFEDEPPIPDADQAYLESVTFDEEGDGPPRSGSVPDTQKYRFFLNPKDYHGSDRHMADEPQDKLPDAPAEASKPASRAVAEPELPATFEEPELPPLPSAHVIQSREEMAKVREVLPGPPTRGLSEKRVLTIVAVAAVLVLAGAGLWGYWLASTAGSERAFRVQEGQPNQLAMQSDVKGHYVTNGPSGTRLFVVSGEVRNDFPQSDRIRWIRIKGIAYADATQSQTLGMTYSYAGNVLDDSQLQKWELAAVKAYYGFTNGRKHLNVAITPGGKVPYQLVFTQLDGKDVRRTVAQVVSYFQDGHAVFVEAP